ncbi:MAG: hypothetical protein ACYDIA_00040 [Candidatus Humimicrobiaceae bacterium]
MTKYKWSFLGLIVSIILFLLFLINPLINFKGSRRIIPVEPIPETIAIELASTNLFYATIYNIPKEKLINIDVEDREKFEEMANKDYEEWYKNVPKKYNWSSLNVFWKSFYHWNLFWIPIIIFSFMTFNYKKVNK